MMVAALLLVSAAAQAKVDMPSIFSDNMVLQQQTQVALWGTATGKKVTITPSWSKAKTVVATTDKDGKWMARIDTPAAGGPYEITVSDGKKKTLRNVLIGEVWLCTGQSNMEMPLRGWSGQPIEHAVEAIMGANPATPIRMIRFSERKADQPIYEGENVWEENTPEVVARTSGTAYFFAQRMQQILQVPIGIISADKGGSAIEAWMSREILEKEFAGEFDLSILAPENKEKWTIKTPAVYYNGMLSQFFPYTIKGILWYQGETNRARPEQYTRLQTRFAQMLREEFQVPDAPFYFVQIAPYRYSNPRSFENGYFYEAQQKTLETIPHSGMVPTVDIGDYTFIHPPKKKEVGERLALLALVNDYGLKGVNADAPTFKSVEFQDGRAIITVNVNKSVGLIPAKTPVEGFEIAGKNKVFFPARAVADKDKIIVEAWEVHKPVAVRYCFRNWAVGTLFGGNGLPLLPFRTDDWDKLRD